MFLSMEEKTFQALQSFSTVEAMNEAIETYEAKHSLGKTDRAILHVISRYACKFIGVCYLRRDGIEITSI